MVVGNEVGENGTKHLQGFISFKFRTKFSTVKKQLPTAHIEKMLGTPTQASDYCKKDGDFEEFGTLPEYFESGAGGGKKKAINYKAIISLCEEGKFSEMKENHPGEYFRHYHTVKRIRMDNPKRPEDLEHLENEWIWGKTGLGKSFTARKDNPGCFVHLKNKWWIGYQDEEVVLFDDVGHHEAAWMGDKLKNWADHYAFPCETKGDGSMIRPKKIIVTSNYSIENLWGHDQDLQDALLRRFKVKHVVDPFPKPVKKVVPPPQMAILVEDSDDGMDSESMTEAYYAEDDSDLENL